MKRFQIKKHQKKIDKLEEVKAFKTKHFYFRT